MPKHRWTPRPTCRFAWSLALLAAACGGAPAPRPEDLEFVHLPVTSLHQAADGSLWLGLGPMARMFWIDPAGATAAQMAAFARAAHQSGAPVYATIWDRDHVPKTPEPTVAAASTQPPLVLYIGDAPDPRAGR